MVNAEDLRDAHQQQLYRDQSRSEKKDEQEVAHIFALEVAACIQNRTPGMNLERYAHFFVLRSAGQADVATLKKALNVFANLQMVNIETNRTIHTKLDSEIINAIDAFCADGQGRRQLITQGAMYRLTLAFNFFTSAQDTFPEGFKNTANFVFKNVFRTE